MDRHYDPFAEELVSNGFRLVKGREQTVWVRGHQIVVFRLWVFFLQILLPLGATYASDSMVQKCFGWSLHSVPPVWRFAVLPLIFFISASLRGIANPCDIIDGFSVPLWVAPTRWYRAGFSGTWPLLYIYTALTWPAAVLLKQSRLEAALLTWATFTSAFVLGYFNSEYKRDSRLNVRPYCITYSIIGSALICLFALRSCKDNSRVACKKEVESIA